ncbi:tRNA (adenosine(37)-N6)-threonylcarbamoyltransferase complex dimerization subunit type 1 TsaB [Dietzia sp. B32]|uniref:tRNA (adenosine(37)-N6)-threonylcarbamoyltransferase complex dimerization subunit type 1 TsaB n=1 Tax=Dietzia sp. B32 TaxID=2915130 RepID=UPI0021AE1599|nr:tRNA (adenosine(37)-N6)-threonylcarbamoyltransferase complex dimerization subunit type 1 TsaB [Dietzia sp. B32]UVE94935.1 tRNA (adenosine(37)-N6)-threonylcarbamoyltransferase complex dimerization subunit type 1 TsaB [Dietzia sp. B32]
MLVLAVDTSTPFVTAGVCRLVPGDHHPHVEPPHVETLATRVTEDPRAHAELLTPHILQCLADAGLTPGDLDAVVVGTGPGPFTGLRVGMATATAFADAVSRPVHGVCSLDGLAATARAAGATGDLVVVTDARRREAYHARYSADGVRTSGPTVGPAAAIDVAGIGHLVGDPARLGEITAADPGVAGAVLAAVSAPDPAGLVAVAAPDLLTGATPAPLEPLYLRRPDAVPPRRAAPSTALRGVQR